MKRTIVLAPVFILAISALYMGFRSNPSYFRRYPRVYEAMAVREDLVEDLEVGGRVMAQEVRDLYTGADALVDKVLVKEGDRVRRDQALVLLASDDGRIAMAQSDAEILRLEQELARLRKLAAADWLQAARGQAELARLALADAEQSYKRAEALFADGAISRAELERSQYELEVAKTRYAGALAELNASEARDPEEDIRKAEADLKVLQLRKHRLANDLEHMTIRAPIDGRVSFVAPREGEPIGRGTRVVQIIDDAELMVESAVAPEDAPKVKLGDAAEISYGATNGGIARAEVAQILLPVKNQDGYGNVGIRLRFAPPRADLIPGTSVRVRIRISRAELAVTVPIEAIQEEAQSAAGNGDYFAVRPATPEKRKYVFVLEDCRETLPEEEDAERRWMLRDNIYQARKVYVRTGLYGTSMVEIRQGIKPFQKVIVYSDREVRDYDRVIVIRRDEGYKRPMDTGNGA